MRSILDNLVRLQILKEKLFRLGVTPCSFSKLNKLFHCPFQWKKKYLHKEKTPYIRGEKQQVVGSFLHNVLEECIKTLIRHGYEGVDFLLQWAKSVEKSKLLHAEIEYANEFKDNTEIILNKVLTTLKKYNLRPYPEFWISNFVDPKAKQVYGKFTLGKNSLSDPNKFWQGSVDLVMIDKDGWGERSLILDYKSYKSDKHALDIHSDMQLLIYALLIFIGFPNIKTIKYVTAVIPTATMEVGGTFERTEFFDINIVKICDFLELFIENLTTCLNNNFFPHTKNDFCSYCPYVLSCKREAEFECYNNESNKLYCGRSPELCYTNCINLT